MSDGRYGEARRALGASFAQAKETARAAYEIAAREAAAWDTFRWAVIALLAANLLLSLVVYRAVSSDIAALKQGRDASARELADLRGEVSKEIADTKTDLIKALSAMQSSLKDAWQSGPAPQVTPKPQAPKLLPVPKPAKKPRH
jgi:hypothetical protein